MKSWFGRAAGQDGPEREQLAGRAFVGGPPGATPGVAAAHGASTVTDSRLVTAVAARRAAVGRATASTTRAPAPSPTAPGTASTSASGATTVADGASSERAGPAAPPAIVGPAAATAPEVAASVLAAASTSTWSPACRNAAAALSASRTGLATRPRPPPAASRDAPSRRTSVSASPRRTGPASNLPTALLAVLSRPAGTSAGGMVTSSRSVARRAVPAARSRAKVSTRRPGGEVGTSDGRAVATAAAVSPPASRARCREVALETSRRIRRRSPITAGRGRGRYRRAPCRTRSPGSRTSSRRLRRAGNGVCRCWPRRRRTPPAG